MKRPRVPHLNPSLRRFPAAGLAAIGLLAFEPTRGAEAGTHQPAPTGIASTSPYYLNPCVDSNQDRIEDYLLGIPEPVSDLYVIFDDAGWNPAVRRAQVEALLVGGPASVRYVSEYSPYVFIDDVEFGVPRVIPPDLQDVLALPGVIGVRAYQRFILTTMTAGTPAEPRPWHETPKDEIDPGELPPGGGVFELGTGGVPLAPAIAPAPVLPTTLVYFVDSGIDGSDAWWGIDAPNEDPLKPDLAQDPKDIAMLKHGTFVKGAAMQTAYALSPGVPHGLIRYADVRVAVGLNGETTTLELTRAFDAIVTHVKHEAAHGRTPRVIVNVSYDTDGGIANHDIIYPKSEGRVAPLAAADRDELRPTAPPAVGARLESGVGPAPLAPNDPCAVELFDTAFRTLGTNHAATIVVGAGNDGQRASYVINPVGRSYHTTIVAAAMEPRTGNPAAYSCYGTAPGGMAQNGHPDLAAWGTMRVSGFDHQLQGTSISTAIVSGVAAATLHKSPTLAPKALLSLLASKGATIPTVLNHWYGDARVKTPNDPRQGTPAPSDTLGAPLPGVQLVAGNERVTLTQPRSGTLTLQLFNVSGRLVRTLHDGPMAPGRHEFDITRGDAAESPLAGGLYFVRAAGGEGVRVAKLLLRR